MWEDPAPRKAQWRSPCETDAATEQGLSMAKRHNSERHNGTAYEPDPAIKRNLAMAGWAKARLAKARLGLHS